MIWMDMLEELRSNANVIAAGAAVITALIAVVALRATARDSRERSRPVVLAAFAEAPESDASILLVVRNYGASAARDIRLEFDPPFTDDQREDDLTAILAGRYDKPVALLPPSAQVSNVYWAGGLVAGSTRLQNHMRTPDEITVRLSYKGNRLRRYRDELHLDVDVVRATTSSVSSDSTRGRLKQIAVAIDKIAVEHRGQSRVLGDMRSALQDSRAPQGNGDAEDPGAV